jgi:hypothetical protein
VNFYDGLTLIGTFKETADPSLYTPLPAGWFLVATDIRGSTDAIRLGRYKEVNMAGASVIAAMNNLTSGGHMLPYLFGGDGALVAIPGEYADKARRIVAYCRQAVRDVYGLEMAAGVIGVDELRADGHEVAVARLHVSEAIDQTVFWGSGISRAEEMVKEHDMLVGVEPLVADFSGLECRWNQIPSQQEEIVSYIIQANGGDDATDVRIYDECFERIKQIYGNESDYHPVSAEAMELTLKPRLLRVEWALRSHGRSALGKLAYAASLVFQVIAGRWLMARGTRTDETDWSVYKADMVRHVDYRKFGDALRFVATGTVRQRMDLTGWLDEQYGLKRLSYGVHPSFAAMVTCYIKSYQHEHVHFVDGTDGGYAKASQELKTRRKALLTG